MTQKKSGFLKYAERLAVEVEGHDHHEHAETYPHHALWKPVPDAYPEGGADHGTDNEGRQAEQILHVPEAGRHVAGSPYDTREHHDGEARRDGPLGREPHAKHHQRGHNRPATDPDEPRERPYQDASQEDQGEGYILTVTIVLAPATGGRVGEGYE